MAALSTIAIAATVASTAVGVAGQVQQAKAQKKAAQNQASIDQANAELAELNAEAQAAGIEKQTEFNLREIGIDRSILGGQTDRQLAGIYQISQFQTAQAGLDTERLSADASYQSGVAARQTASDKADLQAEIAGLVAQGDYERAVLVARGQGGRADLIDEIAALDADVGFAAGQRREEAAETLRRASVAISSINARNAYEQGGLYLSFEAEKAQAGYEKESLAAKGAHDAGSLDRSMAAEIAQAGYEKESLTAKGAFEASSIDRSMAAETADAVNKTGSLEIQQAEAKAQQQDAMLALARNEMSRSLEQQALARQRDRVAGAVRAQAAKAGVAMDGSALDVMMDVGLDTTAEMVRADLSAAQRSDGLAAEMRGRGVQAELYGREAAGVREQSGFKLDQLAAEKSYRGQQTQRDLARVDTQLEYKYQQNQADKAYIAGQTQRDLTRVDTQLEYKYQQYKNESAYRGEDASRQAAEAQAISAFEAAQLRADADNLRRQADEKIKTLERHKDELSANINRDIEYAASNKSRLEADARRKISDVEQKGAEAQDYMARRFEIDKAGLKIESDYAGWQLAEQVRELQISTAEQVAALDREADMTRWRGETEAVNMRDYGTAQAQVLRQSAAATLSAGKSAYSTAMFGAGATLLRGGYSVANALSPASSVSSWGSYGPPKLTANSTGRLTGGV